jgi:Serine aminopeptidase, S33
MMDIDKLMRSEKNQASDEEDDQFRVIDKVIEDPGVVCESPNPGMQDSYPDLKFLNAISSENSLPIHVKPKGLCLEIPPKNLGNLKGTSQSKDGRDSFLNRLSPVDKKKISLMSLSPKSWKGKKSQQLEISVNEAERRKESSLTYISRSKSPTNEHEDRNFIGQFTMSEGCRVTKEYLDSQRTLRLYHTKIEPTIQTSKANLIVLHGFSHSGRFFQAGLRFAEAGYSVHMVDFSGFGYSGGARANSSIEELHQDLICLISTVNINSPLYIYAHSLGALVALTFLIRNPSLHVSGVIMSSPMLSFPSNRKYISLKMLMLKALGVQFDVCPLNLAYAAFFVWV